MARNPYPDTQRQNFFKESIEKEAAARLMNFAKQRGQPISKARQFEVFRKKIENNKHSDSILEHLPSISTKAHHSHKNSDVDDIYGEDRAKIEALLNAPEMRPVTPCVKKTLYDGFTKEGRGRYYYLQQRYNKNPEDKYSFPTCSSWEYGWKLSEVVKKEDIKKPKYGRNKVVDTFYRKSGVLSSCYEAH